MVSALGHDVPGVFVLVFAIGSALAGLAGVIGGFMLLTQPTLAHAVGPIVFVVVVVGGLGSLSGALIASLLIGILQTFAVAVDYSLLDLLRTLGVGLTRASPLLRARVDQARDRCADRTVPVARADARGAPARPARDARRMSDSAIAAEPASASRAAARRPSGAWVWLAAFAVLMVLPHVPGLDSDYGRSLLTQMGDRGGVRAVVQHSVRTDGAAVVRPRRLLRPRRLRGDPSDARDQPRPCRYRSSSCRSPAQRAACSPASCSAR